MPRRVGDTGASGYDNASAQQDKRNSDRTGNTSVRPYRNAASQRNALNSGGAERSQATPIHAQLEGLMRQMASDIASGLGFDGGSFGSSAATHPSMPAMQAPNSSFAHAQAPVTASPATVSTLSVPNESAVKNLLANAWIAPDLAGMDEDSKRIASEAMAAIRSGRYQHMAVRGTDNNRIDAHYHRILIGTHSCAATLRLKADGKATLVVASYENLSPLAMCPVSWASTPTMTPASKSYDELAPTSRNRQVIDALAVSIARNGIMPSREWLNVDGSLTRIFEGVEALGQKWRISSNLLAGQSLYTLASAGTTVIAVHMNDPSAHIVLTSPSFAYAQPPITALIGTEPSSVIANVKKLLADGWIAPDLSWMQESWQAVIAPLMDQIRSGAYAGVLRDLNDNQVDIDCVGFSVWPNFYTAAIRLDRNGTGSLRVLSVNDQSENECPISWASSTSLMTPNFVSYETLPSIDRNIAGALTIAPEVRGMIPTRQWQNNDGSLTCIREGVDVAGMRWHLSTRRTPAQQLYVVASSGTKVIAFYTGLHGGATTSTRA